LSELKRLVLDVLKPHQPSILELTRRLAAPKGITGVTCTLEEVDRETESVKITIEGLNIEYETIDEIVQECGAVIHSIDSVSAGKKIIEEVETPQDHR